MAEKLSTNQLIRTLGRELEYAHRSDTDDKCDGFPKCHVCRLVHKAHKRPTITDREALNMIANRLNNEVAELGCWDSAADTLEMVAGLLTETGRKLK